MKRAYQVTHDDFAAAERSFVASQLGDALDPSFEPGKNPAVNWYMLQIALIVTASLGSGCPGAEIVNLRLQNLIFLRETFDTTMAATLYGVKGKDGDSVVK